MYQQCHYKISSIWLQKDLLLLFIWFNILNITYWYLLSEKLLMQQSHLCVTWSWSRVWFSFSERWGNCKKYTPPPSVPMQSNSHDLSKRRTVTRVALGRRGGGEGEGRVKLQVYLFHSSYMLMMIISARIIARLPNVKPNREGGTDHLNSKISLKIKKKNI